VHADLASAIEALEAKVGVTSSAVTTSLDYRVAALEAAVAALQGSSLPTFVDNEIPSGTVDGSNAVFTLAHTPATASEQFFVNGLRQQRVTDYTIAGAVVTLIVPPDQDSVLVATYRY